MQKEILKRLTRIEEGVRLSTIDNTVLALMIFIVALGLSIQSIGFPKGIIENPYLSVAVILLIMIIIPLISCIYLYSTSIFQKKQSFQTKVNVMTYIFFSVTILIFNWIFLYIASIYEKEHLIPTGITITIESLIIIFSIWLSLKNVRPQLENFFKKEFPNTIESHSKE